MEDDGRTESEKKEPRLMSVSVLKPKAILKFCFLHMPELWRLIQSFNSLIPVSDQKMARLASKHFFQQNNHRGKWVYLLITIQKTCLMQILF